MLFKSVNKETVFAAIMNGFKYFSAKKKYLT
jgi:hypothetical protein